VTLPLTSDDLESDIVVNNSSTLTNSTIWFVAALSLIVDVCTDGRTFLPGLLGHLGEDDLKTEQNTELTAAWPNPFIYNCTFNIRSIVV